MDEWGSVYPTGAHMAVLLAILAGMVLILAASHVQAAERRLVPDTERKIIVLDPGHGGTDGGARGTGGTLEKDLALRIAQMVAMRLRNSYRVILTRSDDYSLPLSKRTEVANHHRADLFLSIHAGGDFRHTTRGVTILSYRETQDPTLSGTNDLLDPGGFGGTGKDWRRIQIPHMAAGKRLAEAVSVHLCTLWQDAPCRTDTAPLAVLMGADMPAALVEIGHLTSPVDEKQLSDQEMRTQIAIAISDAMDAFLRAGSQVRQ